MSKATLQDPHRTMEKNSIGLCSLLRLVVGVGDMDVNVAAVAVVVAAAVVIVIDAEEAVVAVVLS